MEDDTVAYFSMEYAIHPCMRTYSGGLGFLAGSHLRSAYNLGKNLIGIGILFSYGYHDQVRSTENMMEVKFVRRSYAFLEDTGIIFPVTIHGTAVMVRAWYLPPEVFGTAPLYLLSTDIPENDYLSQTISHRLYDVNTATRIAQFILLGDGGGHLLDWLNIEPAVYHMNEGHALPLAFYLYHKFKDLAKVRERLVFTTHTPVKAGNEVLALDMLDKMGAFHRMPRNELLSMAGIEGNNLNFTLTALRFSGKANGVSQLHKKTAEEMWQGYDGVPEIEGITNAQQREYWQDPEMAVYLEKGEDEKLLNRKKAMKARLFEEVADQTGKLMDPEVLTIVWARRVAAYKRIDLILRDYNRFLKLVSSTEKPVQVIWAGKAYPEDEKAREVFNNIIKMTANLRYCAVLTGYELRLSAMLKQGSDVWLNTPRYPHEASGTSGMSAAMNGSVNLSIPDGWIPEFLRHGENGFEIPVKQGQNHHEQDHLENEGLMNVLEKEVLPLYYDHPAKWLEIMKTSMREVVPAFDSDRMVREYYEKLYKV